VFKKRSRTKGVGEEEDYSLFFEFDKIAFSGTGP